jgi:hypothetical protein
MNEIATGLYELGDQLEEEGIEIIVAIDNGGGNAI